jgi:DNA-binding FadR family transcriptional regulator
LLNLQLFDKSGKVSLLTMVDTQTPALAAVFHPVDTPTTYEETVARLGNAVRLGLLSPGERLPAERDLAEQLGISRSTLRAALKTLTQTGHLTAARGRSGGTFVTPNPPSAGAVNVIEFTAWREVLDNRIAVELGVAHLAAERATREDIARMEDMCASMDEMFDDVDGFRRCDARFHICLAESTRSQRLVSAMTAAQGDLTSLLETVPGPPEWLEAANDSHRRIIDAIRRHNPAVAVKRMREHVDSTEVLAHALS